MKVNVINNQNFGKIYVDNEIKSELRKDILRNPVQSIQELKEALACLVEVAQSPNRDVYIDKSGVISYLTPELKGKPYMDMSEYGLAGKFIHTLNRLRSKELQREISEYNKTHKY